jgi:shikimate kinase
MPILLHIVGHPGVGKLSVAREITKLRDFKLVDNHVVNNVLFSVTDLSGKLPAQVFGYIEEIYGILFAYIKSMDAKPDIIMTNYLEERDAGFARVVREFAAAAGYEYAPVILKAEAKTIMERVASPERKAKMKLVDPAVAAGLLKHSLAVIDGAAEIDTTGKTAEETARIVLALPRLSTPDSIFLEK